MNRFIEFIYHDQPLPIIDAYKNDETLSLDAVLEPFSTSIEHLQTYIEKAKVLSTNNIQHDLSKDQIAAIYLYASDWGEQSLNRQLNKALQSGNKESIHSWLGFLNLFYSALEKLPTIKETIYRRLPNDIENQLKNTSEIVCWQFVSCSTSLDIIKSIGDQSSSVCSIEALNCKNITEYTPHPNDLEVLLLPGTRLRIKSANCFEEIDGVDDMDVTSQQESCDNPTPKTDDTVIKSVIVFANGSYYKADYVNGKKQGHGTYHDTNNQLAENQEADDKANGEGVCTFTNGDCFIGLYERGIRQGFGILYQKDGSIEIGEWVDDELKEKTHRKSSSSGEKYSTGESEHYYGIYFDDKGNKYLGNIVDDKAQGLGVRSWNDDSWYQGQFQNDKKQGYGIYFQSNRGHYVGFWEDDEMNGFGRINWKSKSKYEGEFKNGKKHGQGKLIIANKTSQEGQWENDEYVIG